MGEADATTTGEAPGPALQEATALPATDPVTETASAPDVAPMTEAVTRREPAPEYRVPLFLMRPSRHPNLRWHFRTPTLARPVSQLCTASQFAEPEYVAWCDAIQEAPRHHRKQWEFCWILAAMERAGVLRPGKRAPGFGTGREPLPSVLAARGLEVTATDAPPEVLGSDAWASTAQYAEGLMALHHRRIVAEATFRGRVGFRHADMNAIPEDLRGYDACWSSCALEHLGSIEAGLTFIEASLETLAPGGTAIHTTEFNLGSDEETLDAPGLAFFRRRDIEGLLDRLIAKGHAAWPFNTHPGHEPMDAYVDAPPYADPHLKLLAQQHVVTSVGIAVRRAA